MSPLDLCGYLWLIWSGVWFVAARLAAANAMTESRWQRAQHVVPLALAFAFVFLGDALSERWVLPKFLGELGVALTFAGLTFAIWARLHLGRYWSGTITLKTDHRVIRTGPYRWVRHPIYTGLLCALLGSSLCASTLLGSLATPLALLTCWIKIRREERLLSSSLGEEYQRYKDEVPCLIPHP